jgi:capsular polysaccharide biosynthesis protein
MNDRVSAQSERKAPVSIRNLPVNFDQKDLPMFEHELFKELPALEVIELKNIRASSDGLLFERNRIMIESFAFPSNFGKWKRRSVIKAYVQNLLLRSGTRIDHPVVWATDDWSNGYFHWLCDVLPRLVIACDKLGQGALLLPHDFRQLQFVAPSLEALGISRVEYIAHNEIVKCPKMFFPRHTAGSGDFNEPVIREVRENFRRGLKLDSPEANSRIYISREKAGKRRVVNEQQVRDTLREYDFETVHAEDLTFSEQVKKFASARYLVGTHGAGLTNMLFMPPESHVLEFRKIGDSINNCYFNMSSALGIAYYYQLCVAPESHDAHLADLYVDTDLLRKNVELMIGTV